MKQFSEFRAELNESVANTTPEASTTPTNVSVTDTLDEETVHLKPHGTKGTHYKVVKGIKGHLEAGEVIHDTHVDDLHDMGYKVKHLKEDKDLSLSESEQDQYEADLMSEADWKIGAAEDKPLTADEEKEVARGQRYPDYKGHAAAMRKKHNISK